MKSCPMAKLILYIYIYIFFIFLNIFCIFFNYFYICLYNTYNKHIYIYIHMVFYIFLFIYIYLDIYIYIYICIYILIFFCLLFFFCLPGGASPPQTPLIFSGGQSPPRPPRHKGKGRVLLSEGRHYIREDNSKNHSFIVKRRSRLSAQDKVEKLFIFLLF